jgi:methylenetetrahydrofolate reductase (NADPH)
MALVSRSVDVREPVDALLETFSLEMTGKDGPALVSAAGAIPAGTLINITYLATEDAELRLAAAARVRELGFEPVPHLSARRLSGESELRGYLQALRERDACERLFVVGGDPGSAAGPYGDALSVIRSGILQEYGVRGAGIAGYPEGHPHIDEQTLWHALEQKCAALAEQGLEMTIITQFGFDAEPVLDWVAAARERGIAAPIRVGVPGPAGIKRLLAYAKRFGVSTGAEVVRKYGLSLTNLLGTAGPERFLQALAGGYDRARHGELETHFYAFGGLKETAKWVTAFRAEEGSRR